MPYVEMTSRVNIDLDMLAKIFADLDDDSQTQFFVKVAEIGKTWKHGAQFQWISIGGHLANCKCSTEEAREMIRDIAWAIDHSDHGKEEAA